MAIRYIEQDRTFWLDTEHTSYIMAVVDEENFWGMYTTGRNCSIRRHTGTGISDAHRRSTFCSFQK